MEETRERRDVALGLEMPELNGKIGSWVTGRKVTETSLSEKNVVFLEQTTGKEVPLLNSLRGQDLEK